MSKKDLPKDLLECYEFLINLSKKKSGLNYFNVKKSILAKELTVIYNLLSEQHCNFVLYSYLIDNDAIRTLNYIIERNFSLNK